MVEEACNDQRFNGEISMKYNCPICSEEMVESAGDGVTMGDPKLGAFLICRNMKCSAQDVSGHGSNVKDAWRVVQEKFITRLDRE